MVAVRSNRHRRAHAARQARLGDGVSPRPATQDTSFSEIVHSVHYSMNPLARCEVKSQLKNIGNAQAEEIQNMRLQTSTSAWHSRSWFRRRSRYSHRRPREGLRRDALARRVPSPANMQRCTTRMLSSTARSAHRWQIPVTKTPPPTGAPPSHRRYSENQHRLG